MYRVELVPARRARSRTCLLTFNVVLIRAFKRWGGTHTRPAVRSYLAKNLSGGFE